VYREGQLVASSAPGRWREYHLDHLGSPRLVTGPIGLKEAEYHPFPFGEMASESGPAITAREGLFRYTGHQRDIHCEGGCAEPAQDDLDYMLARFYSPTVGRFLGVDPALESADPFRPQTWNRLNYVTDNPLKYLDPTGEVLFFFGVGNDPAEVEKVANSFLHGVDLAIGSDGKASLVPNQELGPPTPEQQALADTFADAINRPENIGITVASNRADVIFGQFITSTIDIADISAVGTGRGVTSAAILAGEVAEFTASQVTRASPTFAGHSNVHPFAVRAREGVSGFNLIPGSEFRRLNFRNTGIVGATHIRGGNRVTVTFLFVNGDLQRVTRTP